MEPQTEAPAVLPTDLVGLSERPTRPRELKMWLAVRKDLRMSKGKIASQAGHAYQWHAVKCTVEGDPVFAEYMRGSTAKVTVVAKNEHALRRIVEEAARVGIQALMITDEGRTELGGEAATSVVFGPAYRDELPKYLAQLRKLRPGDILDPAEAGGEEPEPS